MVICDSWIGYERMVVRQCYYLNGTYMKKDCVRESDVTGAVERSLSLVWRSNTIVSHLHCVMWLRSQRGVTVFTAILTPSEGSALLKLFIVHAL
jgi:hypothetical protein